MAVREIATLFLRLGATAFGGPAAHIAIMEDEVVRRRGWLTRQQFLDYLGATNLIPGPNSTELAIHIGRARAGWPGLLAAGICFVIPATLIVLAIAWMYVRYRALPAADALLYGVKPVVIAVVVHATWRLGATALRSTATWVIAAAAIAAIVAGVHELAVLACALVLGLAMHGGIHRAAAAGVGMVFGGGGALHAATVAEATAGAISLAHLLGIFMKIGAVLFGSGYVLLAFLRADFVHRLGWLTEQQLIDAVAVGQITPGPVFTTATFIGYVLAGVPGAIVSTVGIFLPAFIFVAASGPLIPRMRASQRFAGALDAVNAASLALIVVVGFQLGHAAIVGVLTAAVAVVSLALLWRGVNSAWLIAAGGLLGLAVH